MAKKKTENTQTNETLKKSYDQFLDQVEERQEQFAEGLNAARDRNSRIMDQLIDAYLAGQKDVLAFSKAVAGAPTDYNANMQLAMEMMTKSQQRSMDLGKTLYQEQSDVSSAISKRIKNLVEPLTESSQSFSQPFEKMTEFWADSSDKK